MSRTDVKAMGPVRALAGDADVEDAGRPRLVTDAVAMGDPAIVFQPIMDLASGLVTGYEALSRFPHLGNAAPDLVFAAAHRTGDGDDLESLAVAKAIEAGADRPANSVLSLNVSPSTLLTRQFHDVLPYDMTGLQLEITEHEQIADRDDVITSLRRLRRRGALVAIDDVGEGYAGLQQLMALEPDVIKLDRSLVQNLHDHPAKAALVEAVSRYARHTDTRVCAEGVEHLEELHLLADLDVTAAQGWAIGRPSAGFADADTAARRTCSNALSLILAVGDPMNSGDPDLASVLSRIATTQSLDDLALLMSWVAALVGCAKTELSFVDDRMTYLEAVLPGAWVPEGRRFRISDYPVTRQVLQGNVVAQVIADAPGADDAESRFLRDEGFGSLLMVPVHSGSRAVGLIECYLSSSLPWSRHQIRTMRCVAAVTGPVLENLRHRGAGI
jgi:EAL domain-containing protein (putative c-di-GMP-specific phosphodiesterase class I)